VSLVQRAYDSFLRPRLPRRLSVLNGVVSRRARLFDATDCQPDYEAGIVDALREHVQEGDDVVVVGGGFGVSTVIAAEEVGDSGHVVTYEASREHADIVTEATELNHVDDRVHVHHAVVGKAVSTFGARQGAQSIQPQHLPGCDVLELDCEGAELTILGNMQFRPRVVIAESHGHLGTPAEQLYLDLEEWGYRVVDIAPEVPEKDVWVLTALYRGDA